MIYIFLILIVISFPDIYSNSNSFCGSHLLPKLHKSKSLNKNINSEKELNNKTKNNKRKLSSNEYVPLNIIIDNKYMSYQLQNHVISDKVYDLILNALNKAASMLNSILSIEVEKNVDDEIEGIAIVKDDIINMCYLGPNLYTESLLEDNIIPGDSVIIYPRFHDFEQGERKNILSSASYCYRDSINTNRPLAGFIYIEQNITNIEMRKKNIDKYYTMILLHELTHILVFDQELLDASIFEVIEILGQDRKIIASPKVKEMAKRHFGCPHLKGIEIENQDYDWKNTENEGAAADTPEVFLDQFSNHWDARTMLTDYMTSILYDEMVISDITLALFEDSGWYKVKYYTGGLFRYGKNQGCDFLNSYCVNGDVSKYKNDFCITEETTMCTPGRTHRAMCGLTTYPRELEVYYRYFTNSRKGGYLSQVDYCPVARTNSSYSRTFFYQGHCNYGETELYPESLRYKMGENSICLMSSLTPKNDENLKDYPSSFRALCYKVDCYNNSGERSVRIYIGNNVIYCPVSGGVQTLGGYNGYILCPDYNLVCTGTAWCTDPITCVEKQSESDPDSFIYDYQISTSQEYSSLLDYKVSTGNKVISSGHFFTNKKALKYLGFFIFFFL
jgi:hypothetical protein